MAPLTRRHFLALTGGHARRGTAVRGLATFADRLAAVHLAYFVAIDKGYYKAKGLDVELQNSKGSGDSIAKVDTGRALVAHRAGDSSRSPRPRRRTSAACPRCRARRCRAQPVALRRRPA